MKDSSILDVCGKFMWDKSTETYLKSHLNSSTHLLNLATNHIGPGSADIITSMMKYESSNLEELVFDQCRLTVESSMKIFDALPQSKVTYLSMNQNVLTLEACQKFAEILNQDPVLQFVSFAGCDIPADGCVAIAKSLPNTTHLEILILDSNCIFDKGVIKIAKYLSRSSLKELSISDNHVWKEGTNSLLKAIIDSPNVVSLDISYNIVDLAYLAECLSSSSIRNLSITGCKVSKSQIFLFLESLGRSNLHTLIVEGMNLESQLPISWPHVKDTLWADGPLFMKFTSMINSSKTLDDVRLGFIDLNCISIFKKAISKEVIISMNDFGRTENTWVIHLPEFNVESPLPILQWNSPIRKDESIVLLDIFKNTTFQGEPLDSLSVTNSDLNDQTLQELFSNFHGINLRVLDMSNNSFSDNSVESILKYLNETNIEHLILNKTNITEVGYKILFSNLEKIPYTIVFSFETLNNDEAFTHEFFNDLANLIENDPQLEEMTINGFVTSSDLLLIFAKMKKNSHLKKLIIETEIPDEYKVPNPQILPEVQEGYNAMVDALYHALCDEDSMCVLNTFKFQMLTSVYLFSDAILNLWGEIETKLESNNELE
ncbi:Leucine Rich Repeat family protein [Histomonas meleagridis]|uniref:Leucine Rich Repeat family protein n=1 Tax=Histomonas meleagridis TaxID=135588 RepID=UPI0035596FA1|nr:Leucine Rich Repeat family protein [Histomonas meleagridis]KAH0797765.1 Leucine Rich Repeat family protein [Histomonas meleagridis]